MANTYTLLETITVGAATASSVTFNSIPQTGYTDLVLKMSARSNYATIGDTIYMEFNSSATNFTSKYLRGSGSAADSSSLAQYAGYADGANETANTFSNIDLYIPNYTSANYKSYSVDSVDENNATQAYQVMIAGLWSNTAAINKVTLALNGGRSFVQYSTFSLYGVSALGTTPTKAPKATGGSIIQTDGTYWYHAFLSSGTFTPATALTCDVLVVAGGGGGAGFQLNSGGSGGGGAGGLRTSTLSLAATSYSATIGAGGAGGGPGNGNGVVGNDTTFSSITSAGGGYGGSGVNGGAGGSGGGAAYPIKIGGAASPAGQGNTGGNTTAGIGGAGGGGAGGAGPDVATNTGGNGGIGTNTYSSWLSVTGLGVSGYIAGGGAGGGYNTSGGTGGAGGGGDGVTSAQFINAYPGVANTGSGGGSGGGTTGSTYSGGSGGSGLVIVRYLA